LKNFRKKGKWFRLENEISLLKQLMRNSGMSTKQFNLLKHIFNQLNECRNMNTLRFSPELSQKYANQFNEIYLIVSTAKVVRI